MGQFAKAFGNKPSCIACKNSGRTKVARGIKPESENFANKS